MKVLICLIVAILALLAVAQRTRLETSPVDWSSQTVVAFGVVFPVPTKKDLLLHPVYSVDGPYLSVRRRNNQGSYVQIANFTEGFSLTASSITNGNWVGVISAGIKLFNVENNQMSPTSFVSLQSGYLLSDDTLVGYDPVQLADGNYTIRTYEYNAANMNWTEVAGAVLKIPFETGVQIGDVALYRAYDNHLIVVDSTTLPELSVRIYERQGDLSWNLIETVPVYAVTGSIHYNGVDTLVAFSLDIEDGAAGLVFIYTKINGTWVEQKFTTTSVGYRPMGYLGISAAFVNANNILLSASFEGFTGDGLPESGKVLLVTRNSAGLWEPALDLVGTDFFGLGVGINDYDIIIPSILLVSESEQVLTFHTAPLCIADPINATCIDQQTTNCSDVSTEGLYAIYNTQCGGPVSVSVNGFSLINNQPVSVQLSFTRGYGDDVSCAATVTCPAPPVVGVAPVTNTNVSGSEALQFGLVASVLAFAALLL